MATLQASIFCSFSANYSLKDTKTKFQSSNILVDKLVSQQNHVLPSLITTSLNNENLNPKNNPIENQTNLEAVQEMYAILEIVADRVEMHKNIGAQRDNWNHLLLNSINGMISMASIMSAFGAINSGVHGQTLVLPLKVSSSLLFLAATGFLLVMNKIQPSQLAEEQRNASRLFKQLYEEIKTCLALQNPTSKDVKDAMQKVLALDKAYPLPLLGAMLEKFPEKVEPAVWWPKDDHPHSNPDGIEPGTRVRMSKKSKYFTNGWNKNLEEEMKEIVGVVRARDSAEYVRLSKVALRVNKTLAISGPLFTGLAAIGSAFLGFSSSSWPSIFSVVFGALASVVNALEHGGQVGMVFEMYRSSAGFYKHMEETIESTLKQSEVGERENGELLEVKTALQLGRSLSELRDLASYHHIHENSSNMSSRVEQAKVEFASKLF